MGGVNFTRNRAWWHTAIWDEYNQRHQYLMILPTFALLIPYYYHGCFLNRDLEQNFAAKMYQLDYEHRRNRLTHNLIMEHFETHVEQVQDILDEIKHTGFEETFKNQIETPFAKFPDEKKGSPLYEEWSNDKLAEYNELTTVNKHQDKLILTGGYSLETRQKILEANPRRKYPNTPFKFLHDNPLSLTGEFVDHIVYIPDLKLPADQLKAIKMKSLGEEKKEDSEE